MERLPDLCQPFRRKSPVRALMRCHVFPAEGVELVEQPVLPGATEHHFREGSTEGVVNIERGGEIANRDRGLRDDGGEDEPVLCSDEPASI